jgi:hypothetical protein
LAKAEREHHRLPSGGKRCASFEASRTWSPS